LESFSENRSSLQNALQKQLGDGSNVTLSFDMQGDSSNNSFDQFNDNKQNNNQSSTNSNINVENIEEPEVIETIDYM